MKRSVFSLSALLIISTGVLTVIIFNSDPNSNIAVIRFAFFFCLWLVAGSLYSLVNMILLKEFSQTQGVIFRRAIEFATFIVFTILFASLRVLNIISFVSLILIVVLLELFFISRRRETAK